jgi:peptidoglycan/LPS O-acetylase OafA/YrhL
LAESLKLYPAFWALIIVTVTINQLLNVPWTWRHLTAELLFAQNYFEGMWSHTWTLAIEEHFYIALPLLLFALRQLDKPTGPPFAWLPVCFAIIATSCLTVRYLAFTKEPFQVVPAIFYTHLQMDSLLFGVVISWLLRYGTLQQLSDRIPSWAFWIGGWALLHPAYLRSDKDVWWMPVIGPLSFYCGAGLLLLAALRIRSTQSRLVRLIAFLGSCSYGIYLWHILINGLGMRAFAKLTGLYDARVYLVVYPLAALITGWLSLIFIEQPCLRLREKWFSPTAGN